MDNNHGGRQTTADEHVIEDMGQILLLSMLKDMKAVPELLEESGESRFCIFKVPQEACRPLVISIGPYHHGEPQLHKLEVHKWRCLRALLGRLQPHGSHLEDLINVMAAKERMIRQCYSESTDNLHGHDLVKMMVLDGCFVVEFLRQIAGHVQPDEILSNNSYMYISVVRDLLRLENQVPYFVLEFLFEATTVPEERTSLTLLALKFFDGIVERSDRFSERDGNFKGEHLLDLLRLSLITGDQQITGPEGRRSSNELISSVSKLNQAGITFARIEASTFLDIKFDYNTGIMQIPKLRIDDTLQCILHNMVAFERCFLYCDKYFTAYAMFMGSLIDTANDAQVLCDHGVMSNNGVSEQGIANFFRNVSRDTDWAVSESYLESVIARVNSYARHRLIRVFFAQLLYIRCRYTWKTVLAMLTLTGAIQTVYAVLQYYHPR